MTELTVYAIAGHFSIVFFIFAAFFAYRLFKFNKSAKLWLTIYMSCITLALYSFLNFAPELGVLAEMQGDVRNTLASVLLFLSGALFCWGFWSMNKSFEEFEILGRVVREKFAMFEQLKQKKKKK